MKALVSLPFTGFMLWRIPRIVSLKQPLCQCEKYFSGFKGVQESRKKVFDTSVLDSKKRKNIHLEKRFSSNVQDPATLMNFDVWSHPSLFNFIRDFYYFHFVLKDFSLGEFINSSTKALQVVTTLLSERRFSELEGLLTPECQEEVTRSLQNWTESEISVLSFEPEHLMTSIACDIAIFPGESNKEKQFVEIRVISYVWLEYNKRFSKVDFKAFFNKMDYEGGPPKKLLMGAVYNFKLIKEITKGVTDHWIINKINLKCFPDLFVKY